MLQAFLYSTIIPALLPVVVIFVYIYKMDATEREPIGFVLKVLMYGAIFSIPCAPIEMAAESILTNFFDSSSITFAFWENFLGVAFVEEFFKWLVLWIFVWKSKDFDWSFDGIVYAATSSLGFAALENIEYVISFGTEVSFMRAILSIPGHAAFGIFMGYFFSRSKHASLQGNHSLSRIFMVLTLAVPTIIHGCYDFMLSDQVSETIFPVLFFVFVIVLDVVTIKLLKKEYKSDSFLME